MNINKRLLHKAILEDNEGRTKDFGGTNFNIISEPNENYLITKDSDSDGNSYVFRGNPDNYIKFAGLDWRIIRINGDKTIRIITAENQGICAYNTNSNKSEYVGYTYVEGKQRPETGDIAIDSNLKTVLEEWYQANIINTGFDDKVAIGKFWNDRILESYTQWESVPTNIQYYRACDRTALSDNYARPYLNASSSSLDTYFLKVGTITADEVQFAGGVYNIQNSDFYLHNGQTFWTMTPAYYNGGKATNFYVQGIGTLYTNYLENERGFRPVINLKADTEIIGSGTQEDPYMLVEPVSTDITKINNNVVYRWYFNGHEIDKAYLNNILVFSAGSVTIEYWTDNTVDNKQKIKCNIGDIKQRINKLNTDINELLYINIILDKDDEAVCMDKLFASNGKIKEIDISDITNNHSYYNFKGTFMNCYNLTDIKGLDIIQDLNSTDLSDLFYRSDNLVNIGDISNWNVSNVTNMSRMFCDTDNLSNIGNLANWDISNVKDTSYMFDDSNINISSNMLTNWNTHNIVNMACMLTYANGHSNLSKWNTHNVQNMYDALDRRYNNYIDVRNWNVHNVRDMSSLFFAESMYDLSFLSSWNTHNVQNMSGMFRRCEQLNNVYYIMQQAKLVNIINMSSLFEDCSNLLTVSQRSLNLQKLQTTERMFEDCHNLTTIDLSNWDTPNLKDTRSMFEMTWDNSKLTTVNLANWNFRSVDDIGWMFQTCHNLVTLNLYNSGQLPDDCLIWYAFEDCNKLSTQSLDYIANLYPNYNGWYSNNYITEGTSGAISELVCVNISAAARSIWETKGWFVPYGIIGNLRYTYADDSSVWCNWIPIGTEEALHRWIYNLQRDFPDYGEQNGYNCSLEYKDTSLKLNNLSSMFKDTNIFTNINLSGFNVWNVQDMSDMFMNCANLQNMYTGYWAMRLVNNTSNMFRDCHSLIKYNVYGWNKYNTQSLVNMSNMFRNCYNLTDLNLSPSYFNWTRVNNIEGMLSGCRNLAINIPTGWFGVNATIKSYAELFNDCRNIPNINMYGSYVTQVNNLYRMFYNCSNLKYLNFSPYWGGANLSNVTNIEDMFYNCQNVTNLNCYDWNLSNVTNVENLFADMNNLIDLNCYNWNLMNATITPSMFETWRGYTNLINCNLGNWHFDKIENTERIINAIWRDSTNLQRLDMSRWNLGDCIDLSSVFMERAWGDNTTYLNISYWNTSKILDMSGMFWGSWGQSPLANIELLGWDTSNVYNMNGMFYWRYNLININGIGTWNTANVLDMGRMFENCAKLNIWPNLSTWKLNQLNNTTFMFKNCLNLKAALNLTNWNAPNLKYAASMFENCFDLTTLGNLSNWDVSNLVNASRMFDDCRVLTTIGTLNNWNMQNAENIAFMFWNCTNLTTLGDLSNWDVSNAKDMNLMFYNCRNLITLGNLANWDTSNVQIMWGAFAKTDKLTNLDYVSNWDISNVNLLGYMFSNCTNLISVGSLSNWNTSNVTNMYDMFDNCYKVNSFTNLSHWDVSNVTNMIGVFDDCHSIPNLNVSGWNFNSANSLLALFRNCSNIVNLDASNWNLSQINILASLFYNCCNLRQLNMYNWNVNSGSLNYIGSMFYNCTNLRAISLKDWNVSNVTSTPSMFYNCTNLVNLTFPQTEGIPIIEENMFYNCNKILFYNMYNYTSIPILNNVSAFTGINTNAKIVVPESLYNDWRVATNWVTYQQYIVPKWNEVIEYKRMGASVVNGPDGDRPLPWDQTELEIQITIYGKVKDMLGNEYDNMIIDEYSVIETIEPNLTNSYVNHEFTFTNEASGLTETFMFTQDWNCPYKVDINGGQWLAMTAIANPDVELYEGYQSDYGKGVNNSTCVMRITTKNVRNFVFYLWDSGEANCDYAWVSALDTTTEAFRGNFGASTTPPAITGWRKCEYKDIPAGDHIITITYRKDGSSHQGLDRAFILIPKNQEE